MTPGSKGSGSSRPTPLDAQFNASQVRSCLANALLTARWTSTSVDGRCLPERLFSPRVRSPADDRSPSTDQNGRCARAGGSFAIQSRFWSQLWAFIVSARSLGLSLLFKDDSDLRRTCVHGLG
jgi:hypothetical protein